MPARVTSSFDVVPVRLFSVSRLMPPRGESKFRTCNTITVRGCMSLRWSHLEIALETKAYVCGSADIAGDMVLASSALGRCETVRKYVFCPSIINHSLHRGSSKKPIDLAVRNCPPIIAATSPFFFVAPSFVTSCFMQTIRLQENHVSCKSSCMVFPSHESELSKVQQRVQHEQFV